MQRRHWVHLCALLALSLAVRIAAIDYVGMWVDHGFYSYDTRLILEGKRPFIDFLGRSPAYLYLLAGYRALVGYSPESFRVFLSIIWTLTGLPIYGLARQISGHRSAVVATGGALLLPFSVVYGLWFNTMSLAVLCYLTALWLAAVRDSTLSWLLAGVALGVAFLSRRSVVVLAPAILIYLGVRYHYGDVDASDVGRRVGTIAVGGFGSMGTGYLLLAYGDVGTAWALFEVHAVNLFLTTGRGGWPLLGETVVSVGNGVQSGRIPIFNSLCQLCGKWTARTLAKGLFVAVPAAGIVTGISLSTVADQLDQRLVPYITVPLLMLTGYGAALSLMAGYWVRVATLIALIVICAVAFQSQTPALRLGDRPALLLSILTLGMFIAGYLYRERVLHVYYGMDIWGLLGMVAGLGAVALWRRSEQPLRMVLIGALVLAVVTSGIAAYPLSNIVLHNNDAGWFTPELTNNYAEDINERTEPGDMVLAQTATYLGGTHARMPLDDSRSTGHIYSTFGNSGGAPLDRLYANLSVGMANGDVALVIRGNLTRRLIADNQTTARLFETNYCRVDDAETQALYAQTNATLFEYGDCRDGLRPVVNASA